MSEYLQGAGSWSIELHAFAQLIAQGDPGRLSILLCRQFDRRYCRWPHPLLIATQFAAETKIRFHGDEHAIQLAQWNTSGGVAKDAALVSIFLVPYGLFMLWGVAFAYHDNDFFLETAMGRSLLL